MRTTTHVSVASLTTQPPLAQGSENKWSRKPLAALLTGFLLGVLAPMAAFAQHTAGSLYFVNRTDGSEAFGYLDRDGYFQQTQGYYYTPRPKIGTTHAVNTSMGYSSIMPIGKEWWCRSGTTAMRMTSRPDSTTVVPGPIS